MSPNTEPSVVLNSGYSNEKRLAVKTSCECQRREGIVNVIVIVNCPKL